MCLTHQTRPPEISAEGQVVEGTLASVRPTTGGSGARIRQRQHPGTGHTASPRVKPGASFVAGGRDSGWQGCQNRDRGKAKDKLEKMAETPRTL